MEYLYIFPLEGQPWFKLGITKNLEARLKQHKDTFVDKGVKFKPSDVLYSECDSRHSIGLVETYIKKRFTPVQAAEIFHIDDYDEVKDLIIEYGSPLGISDFKSFEEKRKAAGKKRKELMSPDPAPFEFQEYFYMRFKRALREMKKIVDLSPPAGTDVLKWDVKIYLNEIPQSQRNWLLKKRIRFHLPNEIMVGNPYESDDDFYTYTTPVTSLGRNIRGFRLDHPFHEVKERKGVDGVMETVLVYETKRCVGASYDVFNIEEETVITLNFDFEYLKLHHPEAFYKVYNLLKKP